MPIHPPSTEHHIYEAYKAKLFALNTTLRQHMATEATCRAHIDANPDPRTRQRHYAQLVHTYTAILDIYRLMHAVVTEIGKFQHTLTLEATDLAHRITHMWTSVVVKLNSTSLDITLNNTELMPPPTW